MLRRALFVALAVVGCSDGASKDASVDIDNGSCGAQLRFTGEYVDWDTHTAFCGIKGATLDVASAPTAPNGRFDLCLPAANASTTLVITQPAMSSECSHPTSTYTMPTVIYASKAVIKGGGFYSARSITMARLPAFFTQIAETYDPAKAIVVVHVNGATPRAISLVGDHGAPQVIAGASWAAGDTGSDVVFPNVAATTGKVKLSFAGGGIGEGDIPVTAGTITNVAVIAN